MGKGIACRSYTEGKSRRAPNQGSQSNFRCAAREWFGPTTVSSARECYLEEHRLSIRLCSDGCTIYRKIGNKKDIRELQKVLDTLGEWAVENGKKINAGKVRH